MKYNDHSFLWMISPKGLKKQKSQKDLAYKSFQDDGTSSNGPHGRIIRKTYGLDSIEHYFF